MTLINFAIKDIGTEIRCDKVCSDGYEPENLLLGIQRKGWAQHSGFLAERFINPPVILTLKFPCPVNISHIVLDTQVGSQRSSMIDIYTAIQYRKQKLDYHSPSWNMTNKSDSLVSSVDSKGIGTSTDNRPGDTNWYVPEHEFRKIGSIQCVDQGKICFHNPRFPNNPNFTSDDKSGSKFQYTSELRHHQWAILAAAEYLSVKIVKTISGSVAAISRLEIWGQPAHSCSQLLRTEMFGRYAFATGQPSHQNSITKFQQASVSHDSLENPGKPLKDNVHASSAVSTHSLYGVIVPDEFLDPLTIEIMSVPILLPSGHSVDLSSLDRFADIEASHGRQPSDPFTGVTFTQTKHPLPNTNLKARIDRFLLEHYNEPSLQIVPRAVGHGTQNINTTFNSIGSHILKSLKHTMVTELPNVLVSPGSSSPNGCLKNQGTLSAFANSARVETGYSAAKKARLEIPTVQQETSVQLTRAATADSKGTNEESHESRLKSSLSDSLSSVLQCLPSFTKVNDHGSSIKPLNENDRCGLCSETLIRVNLFCMESVSDTAFYKLPCEHFMCRKCLLASANNGFITCPICHGCFVKAAVVRKYV